MAKTPIRVAVTGAAGNIGYALLFRLASGQMFGADQPLILQLLEIPVEGPQKALKGVAMELEDCAYPLLTDMVLTGDPDVAFKDANWCLLVGSKPRGPGMERADLLKDNGKIFVAQGRSIDAVAADDARIAVVGNPCNTNVMIAASQAKRLPKDRFTATSEGLGDLALSHGRLQGDARFPWIVLIPRRAPATELEDLAAGERDVLMEEILRAGTAVRAVAEALGRPAAKLNVAQLGNVTPQLHVHVIARRPEDAAWPAPVWGFGVAEPYAPAALEVALAAARLALGL